MKTYRKDVSDEEVLAYMKPRLEELMRGVVPRVEKESEAVQGLNVQARSGTAEKTPGPKQTAGIRTAPDLTSEERELLESILAEPDRPVTARTNRLGWSAYKMNEVKKSATGKGLVERFMVNWGKEHGGMVALLALTEDGYKVLGKVPADKPPDNMGLDHSWWEKVIARYNNRKGILAEIEKSVNGKKADVRLTSNGRSWAVEVEMNPNNAVSNVVEDLQAGYDRVVSCCRDRLVAKEVSRRLALYEGYEDIKDKVEIRVLSELQLVKELCGK